jgi:ABC-type dipeptide/oligopeptide/nickel transport system permease subunit
MQERTLENIYLIMLLMALSISLFQFTEIVDLISERIQFYKQTDFFNAMLVCGIKENVIINSEILLKNSIGHIINKFIALFGGTIFLQCSVDFIISVGLSTKVSAVNFPITLGNLLARIDSKQDILAIGHTLMNPTYFSHLFFEHLQGISIAFIIVFSLLCIYKIVNGLSARLEI